MSKQQKDISYNQNQTSSAATQYGGADQGWLSKIKGTLNWIKIPQIDPGKIAGDIKNLIMSGLRGDIVKQVASAIMGGIKNLLGQAKAAFSGQIGSILKVKDKIWGQLNNTAEGQGLAIFGAVATAVTGGGVLLGAGPEVITGMLRVSQLAYTLNLKETDAQIDQQIEGNITSLYAVSGEALGSGLASFVSGGVFKIPRVQINMTKVTILWRALNEEAQTQMMGQLRNLASTAFFTGLRIMTKIFYRDTRKWLKELAKNEPNHPLIAMIPGGAKTVALWGSGGEPWSLSLYIQQKLEKLQSNPAFKNIGVFLENFVEGFGEGIQEFLPDLVRQPIS